MAILKSFYNVITDEDADEALKEQSRTMAVYRETSEFEYRSAATVFVRILQNIPRHQSTDGYMVLESDPIPHESIVSDFVGYEGRLYKIRPETKDEYMKRRIREEISRFGQENEAELEKTFSAHYDVITKKSKGNTIKGYYLGLDILAKKIAIGNRKVRLPPQSTHEVPQT